MSVTSNADESVAPEQISHRRISWLAKVGPVTFVLLLLICCLIWGWASETNSGIQSKAHAEPRILFPFHLPAITFHPRGIAPAAPVSAAPVPPISAPAAPMPPPSPSYYYGIEWQALIAGSSCQSAQLRTKSGGIGATITCQQTPAGRHFRFPAGKFDIDQQVVVPANTIIEGNANPNDPYDKTKKPDPATQTYFIATTGISAPNAAYCGTNNNLRPGQAQRLRIGFLLNSNTMVKNINFQGRDTTRPNDNGNLCGGGAFETPGCVSPGFGDGVGHSWVGKRTGCYDHAGKPNNLILGNGRGVNNVIIDSVRLNDYFNYATGLASQVAVWVAMTNDGSATTNVRVSNLVSMLQRGDGINFHGNVQNSVVENCHIENTGDDIYAFWGAYGANPSGVVFRNNVGKNPGVTRGYGYGVCAAVYGARDVTITGLKCYDLENSYWNKQPNSNGCMVFVHDGWFGAIYPPGNRIKLYDNMYYYMDRPTTQIPESDRPWIRVDPHSAHVVYR